MKDDFKCEICHIKPAKKVWYNSRGEEKYICNICNDVMTAGFNRNFVRYMYDYLQEYVKLNSKKFTKEESELMDCRFQVLHICRIFVTMIGLDGVHFDGDVYSLEHPIIKGITTYTTDVMDEDALTKSVIVGAESKSGKRVEFKIKFSHVQPEFEDKVPPVIDSDLAKFMSIPDFGFECPECWIRMAPMEKYDKEDLDAFFALFDGRYENHPWGDGLKVESRL